MPPRRVGIIKNGRKPAFSAHYAGQKPVIQRRVRSFFGPNSKKYDRINLLLAIRGFIHP